MNLDNLLQSIENRQNERYRAQATHERIGKLSQQLAVELVNGRGVVVETKEDMRALDRHYRQRVKVFIHKQFKDSTEFRDFYKSADRQTRRDLVSVLRQTVKDSLASLVIRQVNGVSSPQWLLDLEAKGGDPAFRAFV